MDGAIIFYFVLAAIILAVTITALVSVSTSANKHEKSDGPGAKAVIGPIDSFKQNLIDINKVPHPKGKGTLWVPSE